MTAFLGLNRAVPSEPLLNRDIPPGLGFETTSWKRLNLYVDKVEALQTPLDGNSVAAAGALARVRSKVNDFGSPAQLRHLVKDHPDVLAADRPPETLYAGLAWVVEHLRVSALSVIATLQQLPSLASSAGSVKDALRKMGRDAENARTAIGPMVEALKRFRTEILDLNAALAAAYKADADELRQMQEDIGRLEVKVEALQKEIAQLGFFATKKKQERTRDLNALRQQQAATTGQSEVLRAALAAIEPILNEGFWLEPGVDDLIDFLDKLRQVLTLFGSGMTQLAADGSDTQLQDTEAMATVVGGDEAIRRWSEIADAAAAFAVRATMGYSAPDATIGDQP
jgi:hypothetical protein